MKNDTIQPNQRFSYFNGLNAVRFIVASLVMLMHIRSTQGTQHLPILPELPIFFKGLNAVYFFFVLSGFLITYLLLKEIEKTKTVNVAKFYLKRVWRIWPLYFIISVIGFSFYWYIAPRIGIGAPIDYNRSAAVLMYLFFGANVINSLYHVGGILHITWSIAIEEQFYLVWAPLIRRFKDSLPVIFAIVFFTSIAINVLNWYDLLGLNEGWKQVVHTFQFHYMAMGGWFAYLLFTKPKELIESFFFRTKKGQIISLLYLVIVFFFYKKINWLEPLLIIPNGLLYVWVILNVSVNPKKLFSLDKPILNYLGKISYGVYIYHMLAVYAIAFLAGKFLTEVSPILFHIVFIVSVFAITLLLASLSWHIIESKILKFGSKKIQQFENRKKDKVLPAIPPMINN